MLPIADEVVEATLGCLPEMVADMVRVQRLTGMRPAEVCALRPIDLDARQSVWLYRPGSHKTEHHGRERVIPIGPRAQAALSAYLEGQPNKHCFSPQQSESLRRQAASTRRKTPPNHGNRAGTNRKRTPRRRPGTSYTVDSYRRAIYRACEKAGVERWAPNRLRHSAATEIRAELGLEASRTVLGHSSASVTEIYAERDLATAVEVATMIG